MSREKGRKLNDNVNHEDCGSGEEETIPVQKKRGRPLKNLKKAVLKADEGDINNLNIDGLKRQKAKYEPKDKEGNFEPVKEESVADETTKSSSVEEEQVKPGGFLQNSRRRKNKPRRAAEAVVELS